MIEVYGPGAVAQGIATGSDMVVFGWLRPLRADCLDPMRLDVSLEGVRMAKEFHTAGSDRCELDLVAFRAPPPKLGSARLELFRDGRTLGGFEVTSLVLPLEVARADSGGPVNRGEELPLSIVSPRKMALSYSWARATAEHELISSGQINEVTELVAVPVPQEVGPMTLRLERQPEYIEMPDCGADYCWTVQTGPVQTLSIEIQ